MVWQGYVVLCGDIHNLIDGVVTLQIDQKPLKDHLDAVGHKDAFLYIEDIAKKARTNYAFDLQDSKAKEFDLKYLEQAVETKGKPVGALGESAPIWERVNFDDPEFKNIQPEIQKTFWQKLFGKNK